MKQDDIEKILQQYGEDKRQQQQIADNLHRMAQRQSRRRIGIVGVAVMMLCVTLTIRNLPQQQGSEPIIAATQKVSTPKTEAVPYPTNEIPFSETPQHSKPRGKEKIHLPANDNTLAESNQTDNSPLFDTAEPQTGIAAAMPTNSVNADTATLPHTTELINTVPLPNAIANATTIYKDNENRLSFISSINASAVSSGSIGYAEVNMTNEIISNVGKTFISINPDFSLSANFGASYAIASTRSSSLDVGVSFSGHLLQGTISDYTVSVTDNGYTNNDEIQYFLSNKEHSYSYFDLFANLPITLNFFPLGKDKTGWSLNITPAHSIVRTHTQGASSTNPFVVNPWKLNVGLGIVLPRKVIRRVALTANLLPLYTSRSIHEIGFEIGF
ncbi:MAG: hypothetical protein IKJ40_05575 [Bacteroidales bacterium]|nr:hypothetical protein [Bacteroidales bacterium]